MWLAFTVRKTVFSSGFLGIFLKTRDAEIILSSIFAAIVLKNDLNSKPILKLFAAVLLLMCKLLGCGLFVGFVLTKSFIPCHI